MTNGARELREQLMKKLTTAERRQRLQISAQLTVDMLNRRAESIAMTLGEENPLRLDLLATRDLLLTLSKEL